MIPKWPKISKKLFVLLGLQYECLDRQSPFFPTIYSYYCSDRNGYAIYGGEQNVIDACNNDTACTGYDYNRNISSGYEYGYLCNQTEYPGNSSKTWQSKLCKKNSKYKIFGLSLTDLRRAQV